MMTRLIQLAGVVQLGIAAANLVLPSRLGYRAGVASAPRIIRQIFYIHSAYIVFILVLFATLCLIFPADLAGASPLGRALSAGLALFWLPRPVIQVFYYDPEVRAQNRAADVFFTLALLWLGLTFAAAALQVV